MGANSKKRSISQRLLVFSTRTVCKELIEQADFYAIGFDFGIVLLIFCY